MKRLASALILALVANFSVSATAGEAYYVLIFGSQTSPKQLKYTHTWATFVHTVGEGTDPNGYFVEHLTISWLPATLKVKVLTLKPETGVNLDLEQSIRAMLANKENITMWGPFVTSPMLYERAARQVYKLESGSEQYRAWDGPFNLDISDCIHAVADIDPDFGRTHYPLIRIGKPASRFIARSFVSRFSEVKKTQDNAWLVARLGIDRYPIEVIAAIETSYLPFGRGGK